MKSSINITRKQARQFLIRHHHLDGKHTLSGKKGIVEYIKKVGCIQFDPLNVAGYNPELVLQSRIDGFKPELLSELLYRDRQLYDAWDKNMAICPVEDWPYLSRTRNKYKGIHTSRFKGKGKIVNQMRRFIDRYGPVTSGDFDHDHKINWPWGPTRFARAALEGMFLWGELIIYNKLGTRKVYDFAEKYIDGKLFHAKDPNPSEDDYFEWLLMRRIRSMGVLPSKSGVAFTGPVHVKSADRKKAAERLLEKGEIFALETDGIKDTVYIAAEDLPVLNSPETRGKRRISILAPLDNLLWDRGLIKDMFDFEYIWEVYKPVSERRHGYYVLPILYGDRFIARFEPVRDQKAGALMIKNWWWEKGGKMSSALENALIIGIKRFLNYLNLHTIILSETANNKKSLKWVQSIEK